MTSSNKARRYLQHHKQHYLDSHNNHQSAAELLIIDPTLAVTSMRKFRGRTQQQPTPVSIPQICVNNPDDNNNNKPNDDDNGHVAILDEFDEVLENELKRTPILRTSSLTQKESSDQMKTPVNQQRSFSFALGSSINLDEKHDDEENHFDVPINISSKSIKLPATIKASLSKETFSRLLHSLTFRSGNHITSKINGTITAGDSSTQHPCLACQNHLNLDLVPKYKKRPSIFGVLVSKLNNHNIPINEDDSYHCTVCKRRLSKSVFYNSINNPNDDNQQLTPSIQNFSSSSLTSAKLLQEHGQVLLRTKRRRSLPSLFHSLFDFDHHDKRRADETQILNRPSFSSIMTHTLLDSIAHEQQQTNDTIKPTSSPMSHSSVSLAESDDSEENINDKSSKQQSTVYDDSSQLTEKVSK